MNPRLIISLLIAGALAFACGPRSRSDVPAATVAAVPARHAEVSAAPATSRKSAAPKKLAKIDSRLDVSVAEHDVRLALAVRNTGSKQAELTFASGQSYEFVV